MPRKTKKICFAGAPSTGKSTLAKHLAEELAKKNRAVELVGEFARDFIVKHGGIKGPADQLLIAKGQKDKEKAASKHNPEFIVCDVPVFLSQVYFRFLNDGVNKMGREELKSAERELWQEIEPDINTYDFVFFLPPELKPEKDGVRLYTDQIENISSRIDEFMHSHNIKHHELRGTIAERANKAFKIILNS